MKLLRWIALLLRIVLFALLLLFAAKNTELALKRQLTAGTSSTAAHNASATSLPAGQPPIDGVV